MKANDSKIMFRPAQSQIKKRDLFESFDEVNSSKYLKMPSVSSVLTSISKKNTMTTEQNLIERKINDPNPKNVVKFEAQRVRESQKHKNAVEKLKNY